MTARSPVLPIQGAMLARMTADDTLSAAVTGVFDHVPEGQDYDYVVIGEATEVPDNRHGGFGRQTTVTLHVWSQHEGYAPALAITARLVELFDHQPLTVPGFHHVATRFEFSQTLTDPEPPGDIRHVPVRFLVVTEQPGT